jgi:anti-anti-sigma factor
VIHGRGRADHIPNAVPDRLAITISEQGTTATISLRGEWHLAERAAMRSAIRNVLARSLRTLVLDLGQLSFIDSTGIHAFSSIKNARRSTTFASSSFLAPERCNAHSRS